MTTPSPFDLLLLEAEVEQAEEELRLGLAVPGKRRPLPHELAAGVRFAELDRAVERTAGETARRAATIRTALLEQLEQLVAGLPSPYAALERLRDLADPTSPASLAGIRDLVEEVAGDVERELVQLARASAAEVLEEARRQGLPALPRVDLDDDVLVALRAAARRVADQPVARGLAVATEQAARLALAAADAAALIAGVVEAVAGASTAGTEDLARQAASSAQGLGRTAAARTTPRPSRVYASELLDGSTCGPCGSVDGREYRTLEDALADYPGASGFVFCDGGLRCRGTLVYVWAEEPATDARIPQRQGPSDPPPERVRPLPPGF